MLDGLNFRVEAGESVAIVGTSGGGKTTPLKVLASLLQPEQGEILVDGEPLKRLGAERYRSMIGVVMQDDDLFARSIADKYLFLLGSRRHRPHRRMRKACGDPRRHPGDADGLWHADRRYRDDAVGRAETAGAATRALYHRPGVLLLDEATSHLDVPTENLVNAAIRNTRVTRIVGEKAVTAIERAGILPAAAVSTVSPIALLPHISSLSPLQQTMSDCNAERSHARNH